MPRLVRNSTLLILLLATIVAGCTKRHYRRQADDEANCLIDQKSVPGGGAIGRYRIDLDPCSRMFDPFDPDHEPMPPDDPVSNRYLQRVDNKRGAIRWDKVDKTPFTENPQWQQCLPLNEKGELVIDTTAAVDLALLHSTDYQEQLEDLYLSALDVSFERFRFDTQFFGGSEVLYTADGRDRATVGGDSSSLLLVAPSRDGNRYRAQKLTATGGELVIGIANSLMWQFSGPNNYTGNTLLDFSIVQPLLRGAGRTRVLERLTISERALLANIRIMERYRRGFYLEVVTGRDSGQGPSRRGGFFGGAGLEGFSGVGGGGFGRVGGGGFGGGGDGGGFTGGAGARDAGGFLGLLQDAQELRNQRANAVALRESVDQLQASYEAGRIDRFQVDLARQALYNAQSQLLQAEAGFEATVEGYQTSLGLPPELTLLLNDPTLDQFQLLDNELTELQNYVSDLLDELRTQLTENQPPAGELPAPGDLPQPEVVPPPGMSLVDILSAAGLIAEAAGQQPAVARDDLKRFEEAIPKRVAMLQRLADREDIEAVGIDSRLLSVEGLNERLQRGSEEVTRLEGRIKKATTDIADIVAQSDAADLATLTTSLEALANDLLELSLVQASLRLDAVTFEPVQIEPEEALAIASAYRRDWANNRASLVDTWRLIYFNGNDLRSDLSLLFSGDISNVGQEPFDLRSSTGRLRVGVQWDSALTRVAERNVYRQSLIEFQQARRNYYQYRDFVYLSLRNTLRQLELNEINFELRRAAVQLAISQVDLTQLRLSEPPKPGVEQTSSPTTARDLVQSLSDLLNVQNDFLSVWVNYQVERLNLEFDLGVMQVDDRGHYIAQTVPLVTYLAEAQSRECVPGATTRVDPGTVKRLIHPLSATDEELEPQIMPLFAPEFPLPEDGDTKPEQPNGAMVDTQVAPASYVADEQLDSNKEQPRRLPRPSE